MSKNLVALDPYSFREEPIEALPFGALRTGPPGSPGLQEGEGEWWPGAQSPGAGVRLQLQAMGRGQLCVTQVRGCGRGCRRSDVACRNSGLMDRWRQTHVRVGKELLEREPRKHLAHALVNGSCLPVAVEARAVLLMLKIQMPPLETWPPSAHLSGSTLCVSCIPNPRGLEAARNQPATFLTLPTLLPTLEVSS